MHLNSAAVCRRGGGGGDTQARYEYINVACKWALGVLPSRLPPPTRNRFSVHLGTVCLVKCARIFWQLSRMRHDAAAAVALREHQKCRKRCDLSARDGRLASFGENSDVLKGSFQVKCFRFQAQALQRGCFDS